MVGVGRGPPRPPAGVRGWLGSAERLADDLQITVTAEGGQLARRLPAPSRYAYNATAPTAPGRRRRLPAGVTAGICQVHPWVRQPFAHGSEVSVKSMETTPSLVTMFAVRGTALSRRASSCASSSARFG